MSKLPSEPAHVLTRTYWSPCESQAEGVVQANGVLRFPPSAPNRIRPRASCKQQAGGCVPQGIRLGGPFGAIKMSCWGGPRASWRDETCMPACLPACLALPCLALPGCCRAGGRAAARKNTNLHLMGKHVSRGQQRPWALGKTNQSNPVTGPPRRAIRGTSLLQSETFSCMPRCLFFSSPSPWQPGSLSGRRHSEAHLFFYSLLTVYISPKVLWNVNDPCPVPPPPCHKATNPA